MAYGNQSPSGVTGQELNMTKTFAIARTHSTLMTLAAATVLGLGLVFAVGLSHNASAHDFAHDSRHSIGFPCH